MSYVVPIFIRCSGHLWDDRKFSQIGETGDLAEPHAVEGRFRAEIRLPVRLGGPQDLRMNTPDAVVPLTFTTVGRGRVQQQPRRSWRPEPARP
ncbi:hypothetical protein ABTY98_03430 [Streptomyces sp. NPDC096040]|uniref:hypothetical protein n=1 Tax=Streptomyces sp. NPDC096040 TaxID=3155541 RepID=UPI00332F08E7